MEKLFEQAFYQSNIAQLIFSIDNTEKIFNNAYCELLGYSISELELLTFQDVTHPLDYEESFKLLQAVIEGNLTTYQIEKRYVHKSGEIIWGLLTVTLLHGTINNKQYIMSKIIDITEKKNMETSLINSEGHYRLLMENFTDIISRNEKDGTCLYVSPTVKKILGYTPEELIRTTPFEYIHIDDIVQVRKNHNLLFLGKNDIVSTYRIKHKDGHYVWLESTMKWLPPLENRGENEFITVTRDITKRIETEKKLKKSENKLSHIVESISDGFVVLDCDLTIVLLNRSAEVLLGINRNEAVGKKLKGVFDQTTSEGFYQTCNNVLAEKKMIVFETFLHRLGKWFQIKIYPLEDGVALYIHDITVLKIMMQQILESEERYRRLVNHSPLPIVVFDEEQILFVNNAGLELYKATQSTQLEGMSLKDLHEEKTWAKIHEVIQQLFTKEAKPIMFEGRNVNLDGQEIHVEYTMIKTDYLGKPAVLAIIKDITKKKKVEQLLIRSEKLAVVGQLAAAVAHEIRNPITSIKGFVQLNKSTKTYNETYNDIIFDELKRIETIIYEFLSMAKPHIEKLETVKFEQLVLQVTTLLESQALMKNITIITEIWEVPFVTCDPNAIKQVLVNVIQNSIEAIEQKGRIEIKLLRIDDNVVIKIRDNGCGISKDRLNKLGEPFYSTKEKGTGLGLMTCLRIIENHKGFISFDSKIGVGTTVEIKLPIQTS